MSLKNKNKQNKQNKQNIDSNTNNDNQTVKVLLFPGEEFEFNEKLITYDAFGYKNGNLTSKTCGYLICDKETNKPIQDNLNQEIYRSIGNYYSPKLEDFVIGTIVYKSSEFYKVDINTYTYAILNCQLFEGATKKTKPNLNLGDLVFAKVLKLNKYDAPLLTCISDNENKKDWTTGESYFGLLKGGTTFKFNKLNAWDLFLSETVLRLQDYIQFELIIGFNGLMFIKSDDYVNEIYDILMKSLILEKKETEKLIHDTFIDKMKIN